MTYWQGSPGFTGSSPSHAIKPPRENPEPAKTDEELRLELRLKHSRARHAAQHAPSYAGTQTPRDVLAAILARMLPRDRAQAAPLADERVKVAAILPDQCGALVMLTTTGAGIERVRTLSLKRADASLPWSVADEQILSSRGPVVSRTGVPSRGTHETAPAAPALASRLRPAHNRESLPRQD